MANFEPILEIKHTLRGPAQRFHCQCLYQDPDQCIVSHTLKTERQLQHISLPANTLTIAYFWKQRPYNLYHFMSAPFPSLKNTDRTTLAYYFNICDQTRWTEQCIEWRDLVVDVLVTPSSLLAADTKPLILDREQLPTDLPEPLRQYINSATDTVLNSYTEIIAEANTQTIYWLQ